MGAGRDLVGRIRRNRAYGAVRDIVYHAYERHVEQSLPTDTDIVPRHVGVILDGNRRWARSMGMDDVNSGHQAGADKISELLDWCTETGVEVVRLWLLSTANLTRHAKEVDTLLRTIGNTVTQLA